MQYVCLVKPFVDGLSVQWFKSQGDVVDIIGSVDPPFNRPYTSRYSGSFKKEQSTGVYTLKIPVVEKQDSGRISCALLEGGPITEKVVTTAEVQVLSNVESISFVNFTEDEAIEFTEGKPMPVACCMNGTTTEPTVRVTIGQTDYSKDFVKNITKVGMCGGSQFMRNPPCSVHSLNIITAYDNAFYASWKDHGKRLRCEGGVAGLNTKAAEIGVIVNFKPKFDCAEKVQVTLHETKAKILCKVISHPALSGVVLKVKLGQKTHTLNPGESVAEEGLSFAEHDVMPGHRYSTVVLTIDEVFARHLIPYGLEAHNALGSSNFRITLTDRPVGASSMLTASLTLIGLCAAALFKFL